MTWYLTHKYNVEIQEIEIVSHTDKTVTLKRRSDSQTYRENITSEYQQYFPSKAEAQKFLLEREQKKRAALCRQLQEVEDNINLLEEQADAK